ncbi:MAG: FkbM family methyltransferase [Acidobacteriaceae bacterium]|nr:FkbM family methyltransferase [Acidobacteriaceae bacterium]
MPKRIAGRLIWTQRRFFRAESPERHIVDWLHEKLRLGDTFFDVGAHYGWIAVHAADCVGHSGRVIAFEPSPALIEVLAFHKDINRLTQLQIVPKAVSDTDSIAVPFFLVNEGLSVRNSLTTGSDDLPYLADVKNLRIEVPSISLDTFSLQTGLAPDLIKIDVEGAELLVLRGAARVLDRFRPILILGVHPFWLAKPQTTTDIFDFLHQHGYTVSDEHVVNFDDTYLADYLCTPSSSIMVARSSSTPSRAAIR